jgi:hypothetical protein
VKSISKAWSEKDLDKLKGLIGSGVSALRVSVALKRSRAVVKQKARELGIPFPTEAELRSKRRQIFLPGVFKTEREKVANDVEHPRSQRVGSKLPVFAPEEPAGRKLRG